MDLKDLLGFGWNVELIRNSLNNNDLIVSFSILLVWLFPPLPLLILYRLNLNRVVCIFLSCYFQINGLIFALKRKPNCVVIIQYLLSVHIFVSRIFKVTLNKNPSWNLHNMGSYFLHIFIGVDKLVVFALVNRDSICFDLSLFQIHSLTIINKLNRV